MYIKPASNPAVKKTVVYILIPNCWPTSPEISSSARLKRFFLVKVQVNLVQTVRGWPLKTTPMIVSDKTVPKSFIFVYRIHDERCIFKVFCKYNINIINIFILIVWISEHHVFKVQKYFKSLTRVSLFFTNVLSMFVRTEFSL